MPPVHDSDACYVPCPWFMCLMSPVFGSGVCYVLCLWFRHLLCPPSLVQASVMSPIFGLGVCSLPWTYFRCLTLCSDSGSVMPHAVWFRYPLLCPMYCVRCLLHPRYSVLFQVSVMPLILFQVSVAMSLVQYTVSHVYCHAHYIMWCQGRTSIAF